MLRSRFVLLCFFEEIWGNFEFFPWEPCSFSVIFDDKSGSCGFYIKFFDSLNEGNSFLQNQLHKRHSFLSKCICTFIDILEQLRLLFSSFRSYIEYFQNYYKQFKIILFIGLTPLFQLRLGYYFSYDQIEFHNRIDKQMIMVQFFIFLISYDKSNRNKRRFRNDFKMAYGKVDDIFSRKKWQRFKEMRYFGQLFFHVWKKNLGDG